MQVDSKYQTKKSLKEAVAAGKKVYPFSNGVHAEPTHNRTVYIEGPAYKPHTWYAQARTDADGAIISIK